MSVEGDLQILLAALVSGRCYPLVAPDLTVTPYIIFSVISNVPQVALSGPVGLENRRVQIDIWGDTYGSVKDLEITVKSTMEASSTTNIPLSIMDLYESETKLFRVTMDFSIWS